MRRVVIESPWAGRGHTTIERWWDHWLNRLYARECLLDSLRQGEAPFASHLIYPQVLKDGDWFERQRGLQAGFAWLGEADLVAVYIDRGQSPGMKLGIDRAKYAKVQYEFRSIHR